MNPSFVTVQGHAEKIFDLASDILAVLDSSGNFLVVNRALSAVLGWPPESAPGSWSDLLHPEDRGQFSAIRVLAERGADPPLLTARFRRSDGSYRILRWSLNGAGEEGLIYAVGRDITALEQERAERERRQLWDFLNRVHDSVVVTDMTGTIVGWNKGAEQIFEYPAEEAIGRHVSMLYLPEDLPAAPASILATVERDGSLEVEMRNRRKRGDICSIRLSITLQRDEQGRATGMVGFAQDVTETRRAAEALADNQQRLRLAQEAADIGTFDVDIPNDRVVVTEELERIYGMAPGSFGSHHEDFFGRVLAEDRERVRSTVRNAIAGGADRVEHEFRIRLPDGRVRWIHGKGKILRDAWGAPHRFLGVDMDITARKEMERALAKQAEALEESNQALQNFAMIASHDLQAPLRRVSSFSRLLLEREAESLSPSAQTWLNRIDVSVRQMQALIDGLLALSRIDANPALDAVNMGEIVAAVLFDLEAPMKSAQAEITVGSLPSVRANRAHMYQLWLNLLSNAVKFRGASPLVIRIDAAASDRERIFSVSDNGIGIPKERIQSIFNLFERAHGGERPGSGIGLSTCKKIVSVHGGRIWAESEPGKGSTFYFTMPRL